MNTNVKDLAVQSGLLFLVGALALFIPAGTLAWPAAWLFLISFVGLVTATHLWLLEHNPGLLRERLDGVVRSGQRGWDRLLMGSMEIFIVIWLVVIALDAVRFHWSIMPIWVQVIGGVVLAVSYYLFFMTFRENSYLSPVVRIQDDRGHQVVSTGPYHYVRHPMYSGIVLFSISTPLLLGSWLGVVLGLLVIVMIARRAVLEENVLRSELQGYPAYMGQVRYRFIPHVW